MKYLLFVQAYRALLQQLDEVGKRALKKEDISFINTVQEQCGIPSAGMLPAVIPQVKSCVKQSYDARRQIWLSRLTPPASEEANRPIERHIALQADLQLLGYVPAVSKVDGVYGEGTRAAISQWQHSHNRSSTGILSDADAKLIEQEVANPSHGAAVAAAAPPTIATPAEAPIGDGLSVTPTPRRTETALIIEGEIRNDAGGARTVPKLRVALRDAKDHELAVRLGRVSDPLTADGAGSRLGAFGMKVTATPTACSLTSNIVLKLAVPPARRRLVGGSAILTDRNRKSYLIVYDAAVGAEFLQPERILSALIPGTY